MIKNIEPTSFSRLFVIDHIAAYAAISCASLNRFLAWTSHLVGGTVSSAIPIFCYIGINAWLWCRSFFRKILDPLMRPIFRIPGIGGFVVTLGYISGYPVGARLTAQLYEQHLLNRREGERLVAFTTSSDPIFLIGAVSIGFFGQAELAVVLAAAHYIGALLIGLLMRFHDRRSERLEPEEKLQIKSFSYRQTLLHQALRAMHEARFLDGRPFLSYCSKQ